MYFTSFLENGKLTIALTGEIDHHCAKAYIQIISSKIEAYMPDICVLDFHDVTFVDSSGIAVVINALRNMTQIEGKLLLSGITPQPMRVFRASGIDKLVDEGASALTTAPCPRRIRRRVRLEARERFGLLDLSKVFSTVCHGDAMSSLPLWTFTPHKIP